MSFYFKGKGPVSKSILLRALIVQSYFPDLEILGDSVCDDVLYMKQGLKNLEKQTPIDCGQGACVLRFLALRATRKKGVFVFTGSPSLFKRPLQELKSILRQFCCDVLIEKNSLTIKSPGHGILGDALTVSASRSSQFVSAVFLNSFHRQEDLFIHIEGDMVSSPYFQMTVELLKKLGMQIVGQGREYFIPAGQKIKNKICEIEPDMSCLFALSALVGKSGKAIFTKWPNHSLQPDFIFPQILRKMGFKVEETDQSLTILGFEGEYLKPIKWNLKDSPDLFPVLASLCSIAKGESRLYGAPHLRYKESDRISQTAMLLNKAGIKTLSLEDGLIIKGPGSKPLLSAFEFDPLEDHRMVMAGAVLKKVSGVPISILNMKTVNKSFPDFLKTTGLLMS